MYQAASETGKKVQTCLRRLILLRLNLNSLWHQASRAKQTQQMAHA